MGLKKIALILDTSASMNDEDLKRGYLLAQQCKKNGAQVDWLAIDRKIWGCFNPIRLNILGGEVSEELWRKGGGRGGSAVIPTLPKALLQYAQQFQSQPDAVLVVSDMYDELDYKMDTQMNGVPVLFMVPNAFILDQGLAGHTNELERWSHCADLNGVLAVGEALLIAKSVSKGQHFTKGRLKKRKICL